MCCFIHYDKQHIVAKHFSIDISLTVIIIFIDSGQLQFTVADSWIDLLQITLITVIGAYFGGRSVEKFQSISKK